MSHLTLSSESALDFKSIDKIDHLGSFPATQIKAPARCRMKTIKKKPRSSLYLHFIEQVIA